MAGEVPHLLAHVHQLPEVGARALGGQVHRGPAGLLGGEAGGGGGPARAGGRGGPAIRAGEAGERVTDQEGVRMVGHISPPAASLLHLLTRDIR